MTISVLHDFQSAKADGGDATLIKPSDWNAEHVLECATNKVLGRATAGTGAVEELACTAAGRALLAAADAAAQIAIIVPNDSVTYAKIQNVSATNKLLGRATSGAGDVEEIGLGTGVSFSGGNLVVESNLPRGYIDGCVLSNNSGDSTNDIDIAAGKCRDSTDTVNITIAASTKQLDANWVAGTSGGMRNSAVGIANGTYHIYAVATAAGVSGIYAHTSTTVATVLTALQAETGGTDYIYARRIGSILRESAALVGFKQYGDYFQRDAISSQSLGTPGTSANTITLPVPTGIRVLAKVNLHAQHSLNAHLHGLLSDLNTTDQAPIAGLSNLSIGEGSTLGGTAAAGACEVEVWTNTSAQVRARWSGSSGVTTNYGTRGWMDPRGKDA